MSPATVTVTALLRQVLRIRSETDKTMMSGEMVQDERSKHAIPVWAVEERCRCGRPASHKIGEEGGDQRVHNLTAYVCCDHFSFVIADCGG